jgi:nucleotide-binding universal stress UspA family protein
MKVLLPTEGSDFSKAAIMKCCKMFDESENTEIRIISAAEPAQVPAEPYAISAEYIGTLDAVALKRANEAVAEAEGEIRKSSPDLAVGMSSKVVTGYPQQTIVEEAENWGADLIIMGSHGYGFWQRALLGSVSDSVVHHAPCSVLVVRPSHEPNGKKNGTTLGEGREVKK